MKTGLIYFQVFCRPPSHPASGQGRMDNQIPGGGCWQRIRTNSEGQTRRQRYVEVKEYSHTVLKVKSIHFLKIILTSCAHDVEQLIIP